MLFFYIRHGDPTYNPDALTPLGHRQAEAVAKRLSLYGIDKIYSSTSNRAYETALPTAEILKKDIERLDFCNENYAWRDFTVVRETGRRWAFQDSQTRKLFLSKEVLSLKDQWFEFGGFADNNFKKGVERVAKESDEFFKSLGYEHIEGTGTYKVLKDNNDRVAMFAHQGFGLAFLSHILDIPYPVFSMHFDTTHSGMTVIEFNNDEEVSVPKVLTLSNDSHIYREGLPTNYCNYLRF